MASKPAPPTTFQALFRQMTWSERRHCRHRMMTGEWFDDWRPDIKRNVLGILDQVDDEAEEADLEARVAASSFREASLLIKRAKQA